MDRLERALQKAREMRKLIGSGVEPTAPVEVAGNRSAARLAAVANTDTSEGQRSVNVAVSESILERNRIVARLTRNASADVFRVLRTKVLFAMAQSNMRTIAVTSANYGDGKSTIAANLALSMALDAKQTVLLADLDIRSPSVHEYLGLDTDIGLTDYFVNDMPVPKCLVKPPFERLVVLPITKPMDNSSEILGSPKMAQLANELKSRYADRLVIYDMPPLLSQDDTLAFLPHVDGVVLVVRDGVTPTEDVEHCLHALGNSNLIGTVLNNSNETRFNDKS